ncbi:Pyridoxal kinase [Furfurilactobacillus rossiae]|uniref:bifunctional hydroxymethylpyrimidine kinase/phosphomethylpyrimidine kinase n=1 Tax=Furfurilactobacillus rossiae TaxID=231049 RepID=UPI0015C10C77|nr:bifunctional hydroxymethylpyrimidine kinase/phosphomethylpyrimidine kinase [Furfurilactobacillus rossiae]MCF6165398.1 bifunctional hydroxymethylpyrimidine kinase/phosphomethylpyrimidine kinase [Furfurilactobacillus rossiae]QLE64312.1 Pyridoxal kinase [Furfurilactobacillus rossiae]
MEKQASNVLSTLIIQDFTALGQMSMTSALTVSQSMDILTASLPVQMLSTQTEGFGQPHREIMADWMEQVWHHWDTIDIKPFTSTLIGYLGTNELAQLVNMEIRQHRNPNLIVDPAMADQGRLYPSLTKSYVEEMRRLMSGAQIALPNVTELGLLSENDLEMTPSDDKLRQALKRCQSFAPNCQVIVTGVKKGSAIGCAWVSGNEIEWVGKNMIKGHFFGTGDLFSATFNVLKLRFPKLDVDQLVSEAMAVDYAAIQETAALPAVQWKLGLQLKDAISLLMTFE